MVEGESEVIMDYYRENQNVFLKYKENPSILCAEEKKKIKNNVLNIILSKGQMRLVYILHEKEGYSLSDIAYMTGLPYATIKKYKQRANKKIKEAFQGS